MKVIGRILLCTLVLLCMAIIIGLILPNNKQLTYSTSVKAPSYLVFDHVNHLEKWGKWFPAADGEPFRFVRIPGKTSGIGAKGIPETKNFLTGDSMMIITSTDPYKSVCMDFNLLSHGKTKYQWTFTNLAEGTRLQWDICLEDMGIFERYNQLIINIITRSFYWQGLENLRLVCEQAASRNPDSCSVIELKELQAHPALSITDSCQDYEINRMLQSVFSELIVYTQIRGLDTGQELFAIFNPASTNEMIVVEAGVLLSDYAAGTNRIRPVLSPSGKHVAAVVKGRYESLDVPYSMMERFIIDNQLKKSGRKWEIYRTGLSITTETDSQETILYIPVE